MRGADAWAALQEAMQFRRQLCRNDDRFVADELSEGDVNEMREMCRICPLFPACENYARQGRPSAGFWAGEKRGTR